MDKKLYEFWLRYKYRIQNLSVILWKINQAVSASNTLKMDTQVDGAITKYVFPCY